MTGTFFMCDGQPAAQLSAMIAADNNKYYTGNVDVHLPDYFPDSESDHSNTAFNKWFKTVDARVGGFLMVHATMLRTMHLGLMASFLHFLVAFMLV